MSKPVEITSMKHLVREYKKSKNERKKMIIMFYADWCGHCHVAKPIYLKHYKEIKRSHDDNTNFYFINHNQSEINELFKIRGYPTFMKIKILSNKLKIQDFKGSYKSNELLHFMSS